MVFIKLCINDGNRKQSRGVPTGVAGLLIFELYYSKMRRKSVIGISRMT